MAEGKVLSIQLVRGKVLNHINEVKELLAFSLINREWYVDVRNQLETRSTFSCVIENQEIIEYTNEIKDPIICGKYLSLTYNLTDNSRIENFEKFTHALRETAVERLPSLEPRIAALSIIISKSMTVMEIVRLLKCSRNAKSITWRVEDFEDKEKLYKLLEKVKKSLKDENLSFPNTKKLDVCGESGTEWDFCADYFINFFPNLENLRVTNKTKDYGATGYFLRKLEEKGKLDQLTDFSWSDPLPVEIWMQFLEKSYNFTKLYLNFHIGEWDIIQFQLFLNKYKDHFEELKLGFEPGFNELHIPPMRKLKLLDLFWRGREESLEPEQVFISEDEGAYPNLQTLKMRGLETKKSMAGFRNISKNTALSSKIQSASAIFNLSRNDYFDYLQVGEEGKILEELDQLFPNSTNNVYTKTTKIPQLITRQCVFL